MPDIKKNNANWKEYGGNNPKSENSKCPDTTSVIASAFNMLIFSENTLSIY